MASELVGTVSSMHRYPVKSMQGEAVTTATFDAIGALGDRRFGVVSDESGQVLSAKRVPALLLASARSAGAPDSVPHIELPDGSIIDQLGDEADERLSAWLGQPVHLRRADDDKGSSYRMSFDVDDEDNDTFDVDTAPGRFFDLAAAHVLTSAALAEAQRLRGDGVWSTHRFRPTILVDTLPELRGFVENDWVGSVLTIGGLQLDVLMPTIRCAMTTRPQPAHGLDRDLDIFKSLGKNNGFNLGLYAAVRTPGSVSVGDDVLVER